jgi:S-formylglutathione hydrolase
VTGVEVVSENRLHGGVQGVYRHESAATGGPMTFALFLPPAATKGRAPCLWWLSGLTCTHENAMLKAGAQGFAARHGLAVVYPDTSPRGEGVADDAAYDLGQGAGFYVDATQAPWAPHFRMKSYVDELRSLVTAEFPVDADRHGITGHSMGGHGALTLAMGAPQRWRSLSAFAPIAHPSASDWGRKQLTAYLGHDEARWARHDATLLMRAEGWPGELLVDQGGADQFLHLLKPEALAAAVAERRVGGAFRIRPGYDHSYWFVTSFIEDHVRFHAERL